MKTYDRGRPGHQSAPDSGDPEPFGRFNYVIVGGGTAGCVLASRLSADPGSRVLLLEAGGRDNYIWIRIPVGYLYCIGNPRTDWRFRTTPQPGLGGRALAYPRGRVLGGCSSINGMIYMRGQARDYDSWRQMGNTGWGWADVLPCFRKSEDYFAGDDAMHGAGGEWRVERQRLSWPILDAFRDACIAAGLAPCDDFNRGDNGGVGYFHVNQRAGWRWTTARGFLRPARRRPNLTVLTGAAATALAGKGRRIDGVVFRHRGAHRLARAGEVILAAGAIGTPHLLMLSGLGPPAHLAAHGIPVRHAAPAVGGNLQDHLQIRCAWRVRGTPTLNDMAGRFRSRLAMALRYALFRTGPMSMAPSQLGAFARSEARLETPDLEYHVQPLSLDSFGEPLHPFPAFTASVCHLRPESRGEVRLASPDPGQPPLISPNYLSTETDRRVAARAIRLTRHIVGQPPLAPFKPEEFRPGVECQTDGELAAAAGAIGTTIFHPVGTARMGVDPDAVLDPGLRVRGVSGLRVADASVMPTITSGNTAAPVIMIAEKAADMIRADRRASRA